MYISKTDIEDRAILNGMEQYGHDPQDDDTHMFMTDAEDQLNEEDIWLIWELHELTVMALADQNLLGASDLAWKLLSGMMVDDDECANDSGEFFYREWEVKSYGNAGWRFDHMLDNETFWDIDITNGLAECDLIDANPVNMINYYGRNANLTELQRAMLDIMLLKYTVTILERVKGEYK